MPANRIMGWAWSLGTNSMAAAIDEGSIKGDEMAQASAALTQRETEVLRLLARGRSYGEIAEQLGVSINTVATHIKKLYLKLDVHTAASAVMRGVDLRLIGRGGS